MRFRMVTMFMAVCILSVAVNAFAETFDINADPTCGQSGSAWSFGAYRHDDGKYLSMVFGHTDLKDVSKYGINAYYLPDGSQPFHPFFFRFGDKLFCSPSTSGAPYDAVLTWTAPGSGTAVFTGSLDIKADLKGTPARGGADSARLIFNGKELWSGNVVGGKPAELKAKFGVKKGDQVRLNIIDAGNAPADITAVSMKVKLSGK